ncbi:MAG: response regulator transcription factor [Candidatus Promineifilaceae bacterium]|nr:response regulator transcription factor [Candidatus Promineifilaceae bacterium]
MTKIRVVIVDDHPVFRQGLYDVLETEPELAVVGEAANGEMAIHLAKEVEPDVMLMDVNLPDIMGLQVTRQIKARHPDLSVVVITGYDDIEQAFHAIRAGASAYCPKDITPENLVAVIKAVNNGRYVVGDRHMDYDEVIKWVEEKVGRLTGNLITDTEDSFVPLSPREMEILEHVTYGKSNKEIAYELGISHQTVKNHMTAILRKLGVEDRTQAAVYALSRGWVRLEKPLRD